MQQGTVDHRAARRGSVARLLRYAWPYRMGWIVLAATSLGATLLSLAQPWPLKVLVDNVIGGQEAGGLLIVLPGASSKAVLAAWAALSVVLIYALSAASDALLAHAWIRVGQRMVYDLSADLFARTLRRSLPFHSRHPVGDTLGRITSDSWCVHKLVDLALLTPLRVILIAGAVVAVMLPMDAQLTLVSLVAAPLIAAGTIWLGRRVRSSSRATRDVEGAMQAHVHQTLTGIQVVKAFAQEEREDERFQEYADKAIRARRKGVLFGSLTELGTGGLNTIGAAVILFVGARRVLDASLSVGELLVFLAYLNILHEQMKALANSYRSVQGLGGQIDRVMEVLESSPEVIDPPRPIRPPAVKGEIRFEDVAYGYERGRPVLRGINLHAGAGQRVAIVGATGAGKSTLVSLIPRLMDPWEGRILLDGRDVRNFALADLRSHISLVLQEPMLFPISIAENIGFGRAGASLEQIRAAARAANADGFISRLARGYDTVPGDRGATLSGGEKQRISIARALLKDAPVLIMDEPTSAVDVETEALVLEALQRLAEGRTTFIIAHRLSTIRDADRILVLENGSIRECGSHQELIRLGGRYAELNRIYRGGPAELASTGASLG